MPAIVRNITQRVADSVKGGDPSVALNTFIRDSALPGFAILIGRTKASYLVESRQGRGGKNVRYTLGTVGKLELDKARQEAKQKLADLAVGKNPVDVLRAARVATISAGEGLDLLIAKKQPRPTTIIGYRKALKALGHRRVQRAA